MLKVPAVINHCSQVAPHSAWGVWRIIYEFYERTDARRDDRTRLSRREQILRRERGSAHYKQEWQISTPVDDALSAELDRPYLYYIVYII